MQDTAKKAFYAAVGAPVVTARWVGTRFGEVAERVSSETRKEYDVWAEEGEKIVTRLGEQPVVEDFASRVDIDQLQGQMHRIREQLEEMLEAWRESFLPEKESIEVEEAKEEKPAAKKEEAEKPAAKKAEAKKPATEAKSEKAEAAAPATEKSEAKKPAAKKPAAKKAPATKSAPKAEDK